jgi:hypothetical protein
MASEAIGSSSTAAGCQRSRVPLILIVVNYEDIAEQRLQLNLLIS